MATYEPWDNERLDGVLKEKGGTVKRLGDVIGIRYKVKVQCAVCGNIWEATPQTLAGAAKAGSGCPICTNEAKKGKHRRAKYKYSDVKRIVEENGYKLLSTEYVNNKAPLEILDEEHGTTITTTFRNFLITYHKKGGGF
jgi:hypothetical protein